MTAPVLKDSRGRFISWKILIDPGQVLSTVGSTNTDPFPARHRTLLTGNWLKNSLLTWLKPCNCSAVDSSFLCLSFTDYHTYIATRRLSFSCLASCPLTFASVSMTCTFTPVLAAASWRTWANTALERNWNNAVGKEWGEAWCQVRPQMQVDPDRSFRDPPSNYQNPDTQKESRHSA